MKIKKIFRYIFLNLAARRSPTLNSRTRLSALEKYEIVMFKDSNPTISLHDVSNHFSALWGKPIGRTTIGDIIRGKSRWINNVQRMRFKSSDME